MVKSVCYLLLFSFIILGCRHTDRADPPPLIVLTKGWKFKKGDSTDYSKTVFSDPSWRPIEVGKDWQAAGYPEYFGYAGYVIKTVIPSSLKSGWGKDTLKINLGLIAFYDQTYLNGHLIGQNNVTLADTATNMPNFTSKYPGWLLSRTYKLATNDSRIHWDKENIIAIRVFSDLDNGGLWAGRPNLAMQGLDDFVVFDKSKFYSIVDQKRMDTLWVLRNIHPRTSFTGDVRLSAVDTMTKKEVFRFERQALVLGPGDSLAVPVSLPMGADPIRFTSLFTETRLNQPLTDTTYIPFVFIK